MSSNDVDSNNEMSMETRIINEFLAEYRVGEEPNRVIGRFKRGVKGDLVPRFSQKDYAEIKSANMTNAFKTHIEFEDRNLNQRQQAVKNILQDVKTNHDRSKFIRMVVEERSKASVERESKRNGHKKKRTSKDKRMMVTLDTPPLFPIEAQAIM